MQISGNTILITGGNTGIGAALAGAFHERGNQVIIAGRNRAALDAVAARFPGMAVAEVDMTDAGSIERLAREVTATHPRLNAVIHNAGIMRNESLAAGGFLADAEETIAVNLLGPIRLTAALLPHLQRAEHPAILTVSSGLAFVPLAATPTYSATKSAIHAYSMTLRHQLAGAGIEVIEIAPPYVQTTLQGAQQATDPNAMPLSDFIKEVMDLLAAGETREVIVERCKPLRYAVENGTQQQIFDQLAGLAH